MSSEKYSPEIVKDETALRQGLAYIAVEAVKLGYVISGRTLPLDTITLFARSDAEYETIARLIEQKGTVSPFSHGPTLYIATDQEIDGHHIQLLGVRRPDPDRPERGYGDYPVPDLAEIKQELAGSEYVTPITSGNGIGLLELRHPDFDVRGYIVQADRQV